jgi:hypothetical protein
VEQKVLHWYPGLFDENELHALPNLRGIPNELNPQLHLSEIRKEWDQFYRENPTATREQFEKKVREIDSKFGHKFNPPRETDE